MHKLHEKLYFQYYLNHTLYFLQIYDSKVNLQTSTVFFAANKKAVRLNLPPKYHLCMTGSAIADNQNSPLNMSSKILSSSHAQ